MYQSQGSPRIRAEMSRILSLVQRKAGQWYVCMYACMYIVCMWCISLCELLDIKILRMYVYDASHTRVGLSVVHLGDRDVPNGKPDKQLLKCKSCIHVCMYVVLY